MRHNLGADCFRYDRHINLLRPYARPRHHFTRWKAAQLSEFGNDFKPLGIY